MNSQSETQNCANGSKYSGGTRMCNHSDWFIEDIPPGSQICLAAPITGAPQCNVPMNRNHIAEIRQSMQDSYIRGPTSGFKLLSVKRLSMNGKGSSHDANALLIRPLLNGDGNPLGTTTNAWRLNLDSTTKFQRHTCHDCRMSIGRSGSEQNEEFEDMDETDVDLNDAGEAVCTGNFSSRCAPAHSREYELPQSAVVNHLKNENNVSNSYGPSRYDYELMQSNLTMNNIAAKQPGHHSTVHKAESPDFAPAIKAKCLAPQHVTSGTCACCRIPYGPWDIQFPGHPNQLPSRVTVADHSNNSHFQLQANQSIQTAPVSGHSSPNQGNIPVIINETSSVPESTSFCTTTATSSRCLTATNCEIDMTSTSHSATSGWLVQMQDNGPIVIYPNDFHDLRRHHQLAPVIINSIPLQPVFSTKFEDRSNAPTNPHRKCGVVAMDPLVSISHNNTNATGTVVPTNNAADSVVLDNSLTNHFLMGSGPTNLAAASNNQPQNSQIAIAGQSSALATTLQPASRFRKARIYETVEQWSCGRTSVHDCRLKVIPEWVVKLRGKSDADASEIKHTNCLSCRQPEICEILPDNQQTVLAQKTQPLTSLCEASDVSNGNTCNLPGSLTICNGTCSKNSQLFSYWNDGTRVSDHSSRNLQVYLSARHALEPYHKPEVHMIHTNGSIEQHNELLLSDHLNGDDTVCTSSVPILQAMSFTGQNEARNGTSTSLRLYSSSDTGPNSPIPPDSDTITQLHAGQHRLDPSTDYLRRYPTAAPLSSPSSLLPDASGKVPVELTGEENGVDSTAIPVLNSAVEFTTLAPARHQYLPNSTSVYLTRDGCASSHKGGEVPAAASPPVGCELIGHILNNQKKSLTPPATVMATNCEDCGRYFLVTGRTPTSVSLGDNPVDGLQNRLQHYRQRQQKSYCSHRASASPQRHGPTRSQNDASHDSAATAQHVEARIHECVDVIRSTLVKALHEMEADKVSLTEQLTAHRVALQQLRHFVPSDAWSRICGDLALSPPASAAPSSHALSNGMASAAKFQDPQFPSLPPHPRHHLEQQHERHHQQKLSLH